MKTQIEILKNIILALLIFIAAGCTKEPPVDTNFDLKIITEGELFAGEAIAFKISGNADYFTFYSGSTGQKFSNYPIDKGTSVLNDFTYLYSSSGIYDLTVIANSYGEQGSKSESSSKSMTINVLDRRATFSQFDIKSPELKGTIDNELGQIIFTVSSALDKSALIPVFFTNSDLAKVQLNGVDQTSGESVVDFSSTKIYTVIASNGDEKQFTIVFNEYPAEIGKQLLTFGMANPEILASINEDTKRVELNLPFGSDTRRVKIWGTSSNKSTIYIGSKTINATAKTIDISLQPTVIKVKSESGDEQPYDLYSTIGQPFTSFTFVGLNPQPKAVINHVDKTIKISVLEGTNVNNLIALFTGNENAVTKIGSVIQESNVTPNDFSNPIIYNVTGISDETSINYTVTVNVVNK